MVTMGDDGANGDDGDDDAEEEEEKQEQEEENDDDANNDDCDGLCQAEPEQNHPHQVSVSPSQTI